MRDRASSRRSQSTKTESRSFEKELVLSWGFNPTASWSIILKKNISKFASSVLGDICYKDRHQGTSM